jgi:hypothetical protein
MNRFFQALIALSGLLITGLLGYQTATNTERQTELAQAQSRYALVALFSEQIDAAFSRCDLDPLLIATDAANELTEEHGLPQYLDYLAAARSKLDEETGVCGDLSSEPADQWAENEPTPPPPGRAGASTTSTPPAPPIQRPDPSASPPPAPSEPAPQQQQVQLEVNPVRNLELRQQEGLMKQAPMEQASGRATQKWYAVLASYKAGLEEGYLPEDLGRMREALAKNGVGDATLEVFRTSVSDYYVIVLSSDGRDREAARNLAAAARSLGLSKEAFVQDDRNWTRCDQPDTVAGLGACTRVPPPSKR